MDYCAYYDSPIGRILLSADEEGLTGLWLAQQRFYASTKSNAALNQDTDVLCCAKDWLNAYFKGEKPSFTPQLHLIGTEFRIRIWKILCEIPYGNTVSYGDVAAAYMQRYNVPRMSAQAIGGAVGHNPISIIVPCHRVIGSGGSLVGYGGGLDRKNYLLDLEKSHL